MSKLVDGLVPSGDWPTVVLDMFGFDGFAATYCLGQYARGP